MLAPGFYSNRMWVGLTTLAFGFQKQAICFLIISVCLTLLLLSHDPGGSLRLVMNGPNRPYSTILGLATEKEAPLNAVRLTPR